jgi:hypothetical protein
MLPDFDRADAIGEFWGYPESRSFAELLIDCEEGRILRAVAVLVPHGSGRHAPGRLCEPLWVEVGYGYRRVPTVAFLQRSHGLPDHPHIV